MPSPRTRLALLLIASMAVPGSSPSAEPYDRESLLVDRLQLDPSVLEGRKIFGQNLVLVRQDPTTSLSRVVLTAVNLAEQDLWVIPILLEDPQGQAGTLFIPFLRAGHEVRLNLGVSPRFNRYGGATTGTPFRPGVVDLLFGLPAKFEVEGHDLKIGAARGTLADVAYRHIEDRRRLIEFLEVVLERPTGSTDLIELIAGNQRSDREEWLPGIVARLPSREGWRVLREGVLGDRTIRYAKLVAPLAEHLCAKPGWAHRRRALELWEQALRGEIGEPGLRRVILERCHAAGAEVQPIMRVVLDEPHLLPAALETLEIHQAVRLGEALVKRSGGQALLASHLGGTTDAERFAKLAPVLTEAASPTSDVIFALLKAEAEVGALEHEKSLLVRDLFASASRGPGFSSKQFAVEVFGAVLNGEIALHPSGLWILEQVPRDDPAVDALIEDVLAQRDFVFPSESVTSARALGLDPVSFSVFILQFLEDCGSSLEAARQCGQAIAEKYPELAGRGLSARFIAALRQLILDDPTSGDIGTVADLYGAWGLRETGITESMCDSARNEVEADRVYRARRILEHAGRIDGDARCIASVKREIGFNRVGTVATRVFVALLLIALAIAPVLLFVRWLRTRGRELKKELRLEEVAKDPASASNIVARRLDSRRWQKELLTALIRARESMEESSGTAGQLAASALGSLATQLQPLANLIRSMALEALDSGGLRSAVVRHGEKAVYILVVPGRHEHPQLIRRYRPFRDGWLSHANQIKAFISEELEIPAVLGLLFFISPEARHAVLLTYYADDTDLLTPTVLLDQTEMATPHGSDFTAHIELSLA